MYASTVSWSYSMTQHLELSRLTPPSLVNAISRHHNKASYSSQALRQVAEQIDALYWASSDSSIDVGGDEVLEKGVDLRRAE